jgi:hypothetical protein
MIAPLLLAAASAFAAGGPRFYGLPEKQIAAELKKIHKDNPDLRSRVEAVSAAFLGTPYKLGGLGEGTGSRFDQDPLYSFGYADCTTSVEQVMALSLTADLDKALHETLQKIRYKDGQVGYTTRNHFTEVDWVPNNAAAGYIEDITEKVSGAKTKYIRKLVSKRDWYAHKTLDDIQGFPPTSPPSERAARLAELQALASGFKDEASTIPYVPIDALPQFLPLIPSGTIANLVREDKADKPTIISHQILLVDKGGVKYVRHAAFGKEYLDVPALDYFYTYFNSSWKLLGLNLNRITEPGGH